MQKHIYKKKKKDKLYINSIGSPLNYIHMQCDAMQWKILLIRSWKYIFGYNIVIKGLL